MGKTLRFILPKMFRRPEPDLIDGRVELAVAGHIYELLAPLPINSQKRCLDHVCDILKDNEQRLAEFDEAFADNDHTRLSRRTA